MLGGRGRGRGGKANSVIFKYVHTYVGKCTHTQTATHKDVGHWVSLSLHCKHHMSNLKDVRSLP